MALVVRATDASLDASTGMFAAQITGLVAGEAIDVAAACYIKAADGKVWMSNGTAANEAAKFDGFSARAALTNQPVTLFGIGARFKYGTTTAGAEYFVAATAGRLDTAATTGGLRAIARAIDDTDIRVTKNSDAV